MARSHICVWVACGHAQTRGSPCQSAREQDVLGWRRTRGPHGRCRCSVARIQDWAAPSAMMKRETFAIANIYVPVKRRKTLDRKIVQDIASSMLDVGQTTPILVRQDGERLVLVEGLHRLEACKALGEETIVGYLVDARKH